MKLTELVLLEGNNYYTVTQPMTVYAHAGWKASNEYYGSSRLHKAQWEPMKLEIGDEIHWLAGGMFAVKDGKGHFMQFMKPTERGAFEKSYGGSHDSERSQEIKKLMKDDSLEKIDKSEASKPKYLT